MSENGKAFDLLLGETKEIKEDLKDIKNKIYRINTRLTKLETERNALSSFFGFMGGILAGALSKLLLGG